MKKIFTCYAPVTGLGKCNGSSASQDYQLQIDSSLCDLLRINDRMGIFTIGSKPFYDTRKKITGIGNSSAKREKMQDSILRMFESLEYPLDMDSDDRKFVKDIFERNGFKHAAKHYLNMEAIYEDSCTRKPLKPMLNEELTGEKNDIERLYSQYGEERRQFFSRIESQKNRLRNVTEKNESDIRFSQTENCQQEISSSKDSEHPVYFMYRNLLNSESPSSKLPRFDSIYDFVIDKGLLTTPSKFNPYTWIIEGDVSSSGTWRTSDLRNFLNNFSLQKVAISNQKEPMKKLIYYLIERITNINLINHIYEIDDEKCISYHCSLSIYPLVEMRLKLVDVLSNIAHDEKNSVFYNIMRTIYHQTFVYFPILNLSYLSALFYVDENQTLTDIPSDAVNLFQEVPPASEEKYRGYVLNPKHDFPDESADKEGLYQAITKVTLLAYYESLSFPPNYNLANAINKEQICLKCLLEKPNNPRFLSQDTTLPPTLEQSIVGYLKHNIFLADVLSFIIDQKDVR